MSFLPIVERELRVRGRSKGTYRARLFSAMAASLFAGLVLLGAEATGGTGAVGGFMFSALGWVTFLYCLTQGVRNTADCLSEEKRAGTLGLLFLTDLRGYDVTLGKLLATSLNSFYGLLAVFPPLGIPLVLGGVTAGEFWRMVLALIVTLFFAVTAGLFVSSMSRDVRRTWSGTVALTAFFVVVVPLLQGVIAWPVSPTCAFLGWNDAGYSASPGTYWTAVWSSLLVSAGFVAAASVILPRAWQEQPELARTRWWSAALRRLDTPKERAARRRLLEVNPVVWLAARSERQSFLIWALILMGSTAGMLFWFIAGNGAPVFIGILVMFILVHLVLSMWVASEACAVFPAARDTGALELLLSTPLPLREIVSGHVLGLTRLFQRPLAVLLTVEVLLLAAYLVQGAGAGMSRQEMVFTVIGVGVCVGVAVMDLFAVARYGLWTGLMARKPGWAVTKTILIVLVMPLALSLPCIALWVLWPVIGIVKNLIFISYAQEKLRRNFRTVVTERYGMAGDEGVPAKPSQRRLESELPPVLPR